MGARENFEIRNSLLDLPAIAGLHIWSYEVTVLSGRVFGIQTKPH
jgi:hypothetical protein